MSFYRLEGNTWLSFCNTRN